MHLISLPALKMTIYLMLFSKFVIQSSLNMAGGVDTAQTQTAKLSKIADMSADTDKPQTTLSA